MRSFGVLVTDSCEGCAPDQVNMHVLAFDQRLGDAALGSVRMRYRQARGRNPKPSTPRTRALCQGRACGPRAHALPPRASADTPPPALSPRLPVLCACPRHMQLHAMRGRHWSTKALAPLN